MSDHPRWNELRAELRAARRLGEVVALLAWDQQVGLPPGGGEGRGEQIAAVSALVHDRVAHPRIGELLDRLAGDPDLDEDERAGLANLRRDHRLAAAVPRELVERMAQLSAKGYDRWLEARQARSFAPFAGVLGELVEVARERAAAIDPGRPPYDVMLDEHEPGATAAELAPMFGRLGAGLRGVIATLPADRPRPSTGGPYPAELQKSLAMELAVALGYDLRAGRVDSAPHPFTTTLGPKDVRITIHADPNDLMDLIGATTHEVGHALYEQSLNDRFAGREGSGLDGPASMGLHESQSRFWENTIGRSLSFFRWLDGPLRARFPGAPPPETWFAAANHVAPGPIRIAADEVTYNLHVLVRFELERALLEGRLAVTDLPEAWNEAYRRELGVDPKDDAEGVLQDVHWSSGAFGYFPSYTLGNVYAAALGRKLEQDVPGLEASVAAGQFGPALAWLVDRVHRFGRRWSALELVRRATERPNLTLADCVDELVARLRRRQEELREIQRGPQGSDGSSAPDPSPR